MPDPKTRSRVPAWLRSALLLLLVSACLPACAAEPGAAAIDFTLADARGEPVKLPALRGSPVYLDFWASWCGPCVKSFPWMNEIQQRHGARGLKIIAVNLDQKRGDADRFLARVPAEFPVLFDPEGRVARAYGLKGMPTSYLIDRQGRVLMEHVGFRDSSREELETALTRLLAQPQP